MNTGYARVSTDDGCKSTKLYNVQHLRANTIDAVSRVCITTIQRVYSLLSGDEELDKSLEEGSMFDSARGIEPRKEVQHNPAVPIETFDIIVSSEEQTEGYNLAAQERALSSTARRTAGFWCCLRQ